MTDFLPLDQHYLRLAKKPASGGVLYLNDKNKILLVKQNYSNHWTIPGGSTEAMESPFKGASREVLEELGVALPVQQLLLVEYKWYGENMDAFNFVFYGGVLNENQISKISIQKEELDEFGFYSFDEATNMIDPANKQKIKFLQKALESGQIIYLENGQEI